MIEINFHPFPVLTTERLLLREITPNDAEDIYRMRSDERLLTYLNFPKMEDMEAAKAYVQKMLNGRRNNEFINWVICRPEDKTLMGTLVFWNISAQNHRAETGYMMRPEYHGKGYMAEALANTIDYAFKEMGLHSIEAVTNPENKASTALLERLKFVKEAHLREDVYWNGRYCDTAIYSLLNTEG